LRALTYLAPSLPLELFEHLCAWIARALGCEVVLASDGRISGPMQGDHDPFADGTADLGFLCSPSYLWLVAQPEPSIELVPAGLVFRDPRHRGSPVYFSDVVVRADHAARSFAQLAGCTWGFNDECSLSGYFATLQKLHQIGCQGEFFGRRVRTGSHLASLELLLEGAIEGAAIDSTVLAHAFRQRPDLARPLRIVDGWGPFPIQPIVARRALGSERIAHIASALLALSSARGAMVPLARLGFAGCVAIDDTAYEDERRALRELGLLS
jgi:ABC-type phosphate/phosphonate transport system substrate-binding protein